MATTSLKLKPILSYTITILLFIILHSQISFSSDFEDVDQEDEVYALDNPLPDFTSRSRFLASIKIIKKGTHCSPSKSICNGVSANNGTSLLYCCKTHCRNILGDRNDCSKCGDKCKFGEFYCNGSCTYVGDNKNHWGKCSKKKECGYA